MKIGNANEMKWMKSFDFPGAKDLSIAINEYDTSSTPYLVVMFKRSLINII